MATNTKLINTRIQNKFDTLKRWEDAEGKLLKGEIALVQVTEQKIDEQGKIIDVPALLMKVGDGETSFDKLPWLSAKAADVYGWAKGETAEGVHVKVITGTNQQGEDIVTDKTLAEWLQSFDEIDGNYGSRLTTIEGALETLVGTGSGSVQEQITEAINGLDYDTERDGLKIVKAVKQSNGIIAVTYDFITKEELPTLDTADIVYSYAEGDKPEVKLSDKLAALDNKDSEHAILLAGITEAGVTTVKGYVDNRFASLLLEDVPTAQTGATDATGFVTKVTQEDGQVAYETHKLPEAVNGSDASKGIVYLGVTGGAAYHDDVFGENVEGSIVNQISAVRRDISEIEQAIAGGVHFRGLTETNIVDASTSDTISLIKVRAEDNTEYTETYKAAAGDVVIYRDSTSTSEREFIWTGDFWEELGDLTRLGILEKLVGGLDDVVKQEELATNNEGEDRNATKFATHIVEKDGKLEVQTARISAVDVSYGTDNTVADTLENFNGRINANEQKLAGIDKTVVDTITNKINELDFDPASIADNGNTTEYKFIDSITQVDGKITEVTKRSIPEATDKVSGIVKLSDAIEGEIGDNNVEADLPGADAHVAATPKAVQTINQKVVSTMARVSDLESTYVKFKADATDSTKYRLALGKDGDFDETVIVFDCGGADNL
jgi:hypothetical protein